MMGKIAQKAYDVALGPHHPFLLKKAAGVAMKACKKREKFIESVCTEQAKITGAEYNEEKLYSDFVILAELSGKLAQQLWAFCKENNLTVLP